MSHADLNRVRDDLETMKEAAGVGLPFGREDVRAGMWCAVCGILISAWALLGPWEYRWVILAPLSLAVVGGFRASVTARRQRAVEPVRWREHRLSGIVAVVAVPLAIGYTQWERQLGFPRELVGAASVFFVGVGALVFAVVNRKRLYYVGAAIPLMTFGLAIPLCSASQVVIAGGLCLMAGGLATAGIQHWQLRSYEKDYGSN